MIFRRCRKIAPAVGETACYNLLMDYVTVVLDMYWAMITYAIPAILPIIIFMLVFSIIKGLLFNDR